MTGKHRGAVPGKYKVMVQKDSSAYMTIPFPLPPAKTKTMYMMENNMVPYPMLPERYSRVEESPLQAEVSRDAAKNTIELKLEGPEPKPRKADPRLKSPAK
jgi:hypothetical protein